MADLLMVGYEDNSGKDLSADVGDNSQWFP